MADRSTNPTTLYSRDILYVLYRASRYLMLASRTWEEAFRRAKTVAIPVLTDNIAGDAPADTSALETALALTTAKIAPKTFSRGFIRKGAQWNIEDEVETGGGAQLQMNLNERLGVELALEVDKAVAGVLAAATYDTVNGSGNDNKLTIGAAGKDFIAPAFPYNATSQSTTPAMGKQIADMLLNAKALLFDKDALAGDNQSVGSGGPTADLVFIAPSGVTLNLLRYVSTLDGFISRESIQGQALLEGGIASSRFFMGRWSGFDIVTDNVIGQPKSDGSTPWDGYVIPSGSSAFTAAALPPRTSDRHYDQGTTDGKAVGIRDAYCRWAASVLRPEHIINVEILSK